MLYVMDDILELKTYILLSKESVQGASVYLSAERAVRIAGALWYFITPTLQFLDAISSIKGKTLWALWLNFKYIIVI